MDMQRDRWGYFAAVDSTRFGDLMSSLWQVGVMGVANLFALERCAHAGFVPFARTLADSYADMGLLPVGDPRGVIGNRAVQFSSGLEVIIYNHEIGRRLSLNSCVGVLSLQNVREPKISWPRIEGRDGEIREIDICEQCVMLGSKVWWGNSPVHRKAAIDTMWRSTPVCVWREILGELCEGYEVKPHWQSVEEGDISADHFGFENIDEEDEMEVDTLYQYWPEEGNTPEVTTYEVREKGEGEGEVEVKMSFFG